MNSYYYPDISARDTAHGHGLLVKKPVTNDNHLLNKHGRLKISKFLIDTKLYPKAFKLLVLKHCLKRKKKTITNILLKVYELSF